MVTTNLTSIVPHVQSIPGFYQPVSSLSHLAAAGAAFTAALPLIRLAKGDGSRVAALVVYSGCVVALLAISGTYHSLDMGGSARALMQQVDHMAIWLLIAGTFTAVHGIMCRGFWRGGVLALIWTYALTGILLQLLWFRIFSGLPGLLMYLILGWAGMASVVKLGRQIGFRAVRPLWLAGVFFSAGAVLEAWRPPFAIAHSVGSHEVFHLAVIAGLAIHWRFIRDLMLVHGPRVWETTRGGDQTTSLVGIAPVAATSPPRC